MKRTVIAAVTLMLMSLSATAQEQAAWRITYDCDALYSKTRQNYRWALDIGSQTAVFYNTQMRAFLEEKEAVLKVSDISQAMALVTQVTAKYSGRNNLQVLIDRSRGEYTYTNTIAMDEFIYDEPLPAPLWELSDSIGTVCGYECRTASIRLYGREWKVLYAPEIPLPYGPYVLGGLPGLILDARDSEGIFHFTAIGIEEAPEGTEIALTPSNKRIECSRKKYISLRNSDAEKTYAESFKGHGDITVKDAKGNDITNSQKPKRNYLDIE